MAITEITPVAIEYAGELGSLADLTDAANADGSWFYCHHPHRTFIFLENTNAAARVMTIEGQMEDPFTGTVTDTDYTIAIGSVTEQFGFVPVNKWQIDDAGKVHISFDAVTNLNIGVYVVGED